MKDPLPRLYTLFKNGRHPVKTRPSVHRTAGSHLLIKTPLFTRAEMDNHLGECGKSISEDNHAYQPVPTGLKKKTKILHDIQTNYDHQYFYYRVKCFHNFKTNESSHNLIITQCMISGEVVYANCGSLCCREISILQTRFSYDT